MIDIGVSRHLFSYHFVVNRAIRSLYPAFSPLSGRRHAVARREPLAVNKKKSTAGFSSNSLESIPVSRTLSISLNDGLVSGRLTGTVFHVIKRLANQQFCRLPAISSSCLFGAPTPFPSPMPSRSTSPPNMTSARICLQRIC